MVEEKQLKIYDAMFIFPTDLDQPELDKCCEWINAELARQEGRLLESDVVGRRTFARPMKKATEGFFLRMRLEMPAAGVAEFTSRLKLNTQIFRVQILVSDGLPFDKSAEEEKEDDAPAAAAKVAVTAKEEPVNG